MCDVSTHSSSPLGHPSLHACLEALFAWHRATYCEIYNEQLYDLLRFSKQQLSVRWDAQRGFHAPDLASKDCATVEDLLQVPVHMHLVLHEICVLPSSMQVCQHSNAG